MTSSARARIDGGIVRPSALAVLRLTTSSKVVGCSTGNSLAFAVAKLAQAVQERARDPASRLGAGHLGGRVNRAQDPDPVDLARQLRAGDMGHGENPDCEAADERSPVHQSITSCVRSWSDAGLL